MSVAVPNHFNVSVSSSRIGQRVLRAKVNHNSSCQSIGNDEVAVSLVPDSGGVELTVLILANFSRPQELALSNGVRNCVALGSEARSWLPRKTSMAK